jgi:hypothetical protein
MLKKVRRRNKQAEAASHDPFAPEFGNDTWHIGGKTQAGMDPSKVTFMCLYMCVLMCVCVCDRMCVCVRMCV